MMRLMLLGTVRRAGNDGDSLVLCVLGSQAAFTDLTDVGVVRHTGNNDIDLLVLCA